MNCEQRNRAATSAHLHGLSPLSSRALVGFLPTGTAAGLSGRAADHERAVRCRRGCRRGAAGAAPWGLLRSRPAGAGFPAVLRAVVASPNSLHSLRSLRSDSGDESVHKAREYARRPRRCVPRRLPSRPHGAAPAALNRWWPASRWHAAVGSAKDRAGRPRRAYEAPRSAGLAARARNARIVI